MSEEIDKIPLPPFLYRDGRGIFIGYHGDTNVTDEWNEYLKSIVALLKAIPNEQAGGKQ
jgi:hypothetical protein